MKKHTQSGFSLVEVLLAAVIFSFLATALSGAIIYGRSSTANAGNYVLATQLADEGIQATTHIHNAAYTNLVNGTYGLGQASNTWSLNATPDITEIYTRHITVADAGTNRKTVTSKVTWQQNGAEANVTLMTRLTNWAEAAVVVLKSWANAIASGSVDTTGTIDGLKVATNGNYAYVIRATTTQGLMIYNISNPATPTLVGSATLLATPADIAISGNYAYIASSDNAAEMQVVNITNPAAPVVAANFNGAGTNDGRAIAVNGNYAYLARAAGGGVNIINITNPNAPVVTGTYASTFTLNDVIFYNNYLFVATNAASQEVLVVNVTVPGSPTLTTSYDLTTTGAVQSLDIVGTTLLIGHGTTLHLRNITTVTTPTVVGSIAISGATLLNSIDTDSTGKYVFLATNSTTGEFRVIDIGTPATPTLVRTVDKAGATSLTGLAYNASLESVVTTSASDTAEIGIYVPN